MGFLHRYSIATKIMTGFGLFFALALGLTVLAVFQMRHTASAGQLIVEDDADELHSVQALQENLDSVQPDRFRNRLRRHARRAGGARDEIPRRDA